MCIANFLVAASATMILPFLSLYIETFGSFDTAYVQRWSGFIFGITFLIAFFLSPLWGRFGDRYGRKPILIITGTGIAACIFFMGVVTTVPQLFFLRMFMGIFTGFIPTSMALISAQTPKEISGKTLGILQSGTVSGGLFGPVIGGLLADSVGFQYTFLVTAILILSANLFVLFGIKEIRPELSANQKKYTSKEVVKHIMQSPTLVVIMVISLLIQVANFAIQPLLSLYVYELTKQATNISLLAGVTFSATGLGNLLATRSWGSLGDKIGHGKVMLILLLLATIFYLPQGLVTNIWQLIILRFLFGIQIGGIIPCMTAYIRQVAPSSILGEVLGYNVSFRFLGNVIGPVLGGLLAGYIGISSVFFVTSGLFLLSFLFLWMSRSKEQARTAQNHKEALRQGI